MKDRKGAPMDFSHKRVLVLGLGKSGKAASELLAKLGADVVASDYSVSAKMEETAEELRSEGVKVILGPQKDYLLDGVNIVVVSPGIPSETPIVSSARACRIPVWSEIELAYRLTDKKIIAITGTNGKTTTTTLIGKIFEVAAKKAAVVGNIGIPLVLAATDPSVDVLIVEVSSFQLDSISEFKPHIAVLLNITEDHLDWHPDFEDYVRAKRRLFMNQNRDDYAVINVDDDVLRSLIPGLKARCLTTSKHRFDTNVYVKNDTIIASFNEDLGSSGIEAVCNIDDLNVLGEHNLDNVMAAVCTCRCAGIGLDSIRKAVSGFKGLSHRIEHVATIEGVDYYDDSKATNIDATIKAVAAFSEPIVLLVGGRNKGNGFKPLARAIHPGIKAIVGFGESGLEILAEMSEDVVKEYVKTVDDAVVLANKIAKPGHVVLFSPACASFDAFDNYAQRGDVFKNAVISLGDIDDKKEK